MEGLVVQDDDGLSSQSEALVEVTRDEHEALDLTARLAVEALTPEAPAVRLERIHGGFRVLQGHEELARARNPARLRDALELADAWGWEGQWRA